MKAPRILLLALAVISTGVTHADERSYLAIWSGASFGNDVQAVARVVIEDTLLPNPGAFAAPIASGNPVVSLDITVTGTTGGTGDGTFTSSNWDECSISIGNQLDPAADWVGQPQSVAAGVWGNATTGAHDFNFITPNSGAPLGVGRYVLRTATLEDMRLICFVPIEFGGPGARFAIGDTADLNLSVLIEGGLAPQTGESLRVTGLPKGLTFDPVTQKITGPVLAMPNPNGVQIQVTQGSKVLRGLPYHLMIEPYPFAGGFEVLLGHPGGVIADTNSDAITIPSDAPANASIFPTTLTFAATSIPTPPTALRVTLTGLTHSFPNDLDIFLMAPNGQVAVVMSDAGGSGPGVSNVDLTFSDAASSAVPDGPASGTYLPTDITVGDPDTLPPGMVGPLASNLNALLAGGTEGEWKLFVSDDTGGEGGGLTSWSLEFDYTPGPIGKVKVTVAPPSKKSPLASFSATMEQLRQPRRSTRGTFVPSGGFVQAIPVEFPAVKSLPAFPIEFTLEEDEQSVFDAGPGPVMAQGARLASLGRLPGGNPAFTIPLMTAPPTDGVTTPGGVGHATATINPKGLIRTRGLLGDGTPFTASLNLANDQTAVVWLTPYKNKASYLGGQMFVGFPIPFGNGWLPIYALLPPTFPPFLDWRVEPDARAKSYPAGFGPLLVDAVAAHWLPTPQPEALAVGLGLQSRTLYLDAISPAPPATPTAVSLRDNSTLLAISPLNAAPLKAKANGKTGTFAGQLTFPGPASKAAVSGIFFQSFFTAPDVGAGLIKIPVTGPGLPKDSFQTAGFFLQNYVE